MQAYNIYNEKGLKDFETEYNVKVDYSTGNSSQFRHCQAWDILGDLVWTDESTGKLRKCDIYILQSYNTLVALYIPKDKGDLSPLGDGVKIRLGGYSKTRTTSKQITQWFNEMDRWEQSREWRKKYGY